jgi:transcription elongation factor Elf1
MPPKKLLKTKCLMCGNEMKVLKHTPRQIVLECSHCGIEMEIKAVKVK